MATREHTLRRSASTPRDPARRMVYVRRRTTALCVLLLLVTWLAGLGPGAPHHAPKPAKAGQASTANSALAATAAEYTREQNAINSVLAYTPFITSGGGAKREVALTFDDGPGPFTPQVIAALQKQQVPATFFVVGSGLRYFSPALLSAVNAGFVIGDHTEDHRAMATLSPQDQRAQLLQQVTAIRALGAPYPHLFRPPYGSYDKTTLAIAKKLGMLTVLWTVDTSDYQQPGVAAIVQGVLSQVHPGAIVLMHDAGGQRQQTIAAIPILVNALRRRGYTLVTVPRLMADDPPPASSTRTTPNLVGG